MKSLLLVILVVLSGSQLCFAQDLSKVTRADIIKTVQHIQRLAKEQKGQLIQAQSDYLKQADALLKQTAIADQKTKEAHDNAKQRDSILILFGVIAAAYFGTFFAGPILREFPTPWNLVGVSAAYLLTGLAGYALGRLIVVNLARFIP
jgi:hypothetical protein